MEEVVVGVAVGVAVAIALVCDWRSTSKVMRTAHWECVWMQAPAPRLKAARKRFVQADGLWFLLKG